MEGKNMGFSNRSDKIIEIKDMLEDMNEQQVENVHTYTQNELREPNHEAVALEAIIQLSRKYGK